MPLSSAHLNFSKSHFIGQGQVCIKLIQEKAISVFVSFKSILEKIQ